MQNNPLIDIILARGFIPIAHHSNRVYKRIEQEARLRLRLLTNADGAFYFIKSSSHNAYTLYAENRNIVLISDGLLLFLEKCISKLMESNSVSSFFRHRLGIVYECRKTPFPLYSGHKDSFFDLKDAADDEWYYAISYGAFDGAVAFILLHEISHILGDYHFDHANLAGSISDLLRKEELGEVYEERRADQEASWWLANRVHDCLAESFSQPISSHVAVLHYVTAYFGTLAAVIHLSTSDEFGTEKPVDHPTFETRLEGVWESLENFVHEKYQPTFDWKGAPVSDVIGRLVKRTDEQVALALFGYNITHMVHELTKAVQIEVFGKPSKYAFSLDELGWRQDL